MTSGAATSRERAARALLCGGPLAGGALGSLPAQAAYALHATISRCRSALDAAARARARRPRAGVFAPEQRGLLFQHLPPHDAALQLQGDAHVRDALAARPR